MLENGTIIDGKYEILSKVGQGGMSVVYLALNRKAMKQWAIKEVRRDGVKNFEVVKQSLVAETDMLKKLSHPNLPDIVDIIENDDSFLIVMDYIEGNPLSKRIEETGAQPEEYVIEWAKQLCDVLDYLHTRQPAIVYRDMKPSNVMLKPDGQVSLIDFGTAREYKGTNLQDTTCLGTIGYAAPEQFGGQGETDARTDIYCLGATLYHLITGHSPAEPPYEMHPIRYWNEQLSPGLEAIILKCTQKDPNDRYQSCAELKYALEHIDEGVYEYWLSQKKKFNLFLTSIIAALLCLVVGITGTILTSTQTSNMYKSYIANAANAGSDSGAAINNYVSALELDYDYDAAEQASQLVEMLKAYSYDETITLEELNQFKNVIGFSSSENADSEHEHMAYIKDRDANVYYDLCYKIGVYCISYAKNDEASPYVEKTAFAAANPFFKELPEVDSEEYAALEDETVKADCRMASNYRIIAKYDTEAGNNNSELDSNQAAYKDMFDALSDAVVNVTTETNEVLRYRVYEAAISFLADDQNVQYCLTQGVTRDQMATMISNVSSAISAQPTDLTANEIRTNVMNIIDSASDKIS